MDTTTRSIPDSDDLARLVGGARAFVDLVHQIPAIAKSDASILIRGETGTGKELVARAIHYCSGRAGFPFVAVNCGSFVENLLEVELFGHERGAFTGSIGRKTGLLAQAHKGTLFLDEVDALSPKAQVDLLRVLQEKKFRAVGSERDQETNVRIVAASNAQFDPLLHCRAFRADLYYRLCVFSLWLPALRDRKQDILLLAAHFLRKHLPAEKGALILSEGAAAALLSWDWPGNVRELENAIIRGIHLSTTSLIEADGLCLPAPAESAHAGPLCFRSMKRTAVEKFEKDYLIRLMSEHGGNVTQAAATAQKERRDLGKLLKKHAVDPRLFRGMRAAAGGC